MEKRSPKDVENLLFLTLACGATVETAAKQTQVSEAVVRRRLASKTFQTRLQQFKEDMFRRAAGLAAAASAESVKKIIQLQSASTSPAVQLAAAKTIIKMAAELRELAEIERNAAEFEKQSTRWNR